MSNDKYVCSLKSIAVKAGEIILSYYGKSFDIKIKKDNSPVTEADMEADAFITSELYKLDSSIPVISEESESNQLENYNDKFWLVDPLDGTRGYIKQNGEFTVNICLIDKRKPSVGVIYIPSTDTLYYNYQNKSYKQIAQYEPEIIEARQAGGNVILTAGNKEYSEKDNDFIDNFHPKSCIFISSSIKFCLLAEGVADIYPAMHATMEWDTAAGQAILTNAGGRVEDTNGSILSYGKEGFANGYFIAYGK